MDPVGEEIEMPEDRESAGSDRRGPAQWVPKGALSRFLVQGTSWAFVVQILGLTSGIASQVFLARLIPPEALGVYFLLQSIVIVVANVGEFGLNRPLARMVSTDVGAGRVGSALRVVRSAVRISGVAGSVVVIAFVGGAGGWLARHVFESSLMESTVLLVGLWIAGRIVLSISAAVLQGLHRVGLSAMFSGAFSTTVVAAIFGLLLWTGTSCEFDEIIAIATGATVVAALLCVATAWAPFSGVRVAGPPRTGELFSSTLPIFAAGVLQLAAIQADLLIVGVQLDASDVALYGAAKKLTVLVGFPVMVVSYVVPPLIADLYSRGERERLQRMMRTATTATSLPAVGAFVLFILFGPEILTLAYGEVYAEATTILKILCVERIVFIMMGSGSLLLVMTGHERAVFRITMVSATLSLAAIYVGGLVADLLGVAVGYALSSVATGLWYLLEAHRRTGIWSHVSPLAVRPMIEVMQRMIRR